MIISQLLWKLVDWINLIWYNDSISEDMIRKSFIDIGIMNDFDGSEDECFKFPNIVSDYIEDDMDNVNMINNKSFIDYDNSENKNR